MKLILAIAIAITAVSLHAQAANPRYNCTGSCLFVADAYPSTGPVPTSCRLKHASTQSLIASAPAVAVSGGVQCQVRATFAVGTYTVVMTAVDSAGQESPPSAPFAFDSAVPLPPPANLRIL